MSHNPSATNPSTPFLRFIALALCYSLLLPSATLGTLASKVSAQPQPQAAATQTQPAARRPGELLIRFSRYASDADKQRVYESRQPQTRRPLNGSSNTDIARFSSDQDLDALMTELRLYPEVERVEPNYLISADQEARTPNDTRFGEQWALHNMDESGARKPSDIHAPEAWGQTVGASSTIIAVIDSGIDFSHPDLQNNRWTNPGERKNDNKDDDRNGYKDDFHGWDWIANASEITDEHGHGTAVAGIIAAEGDNNFGMAGVMWRASLMDLRVLDGSGTGDIARAIEAIDYAATHGAQVINLSWSTQGESSFLSDAILRAGRRGVFVVTSAGNNGEDLAASPRYPAAFDLPNLVSVAATDNTDHLASTSNWGSQRVTLGAPGVNILTTRKGGGHATLSGTSAAAAVVSGVAGLMRTQRPHLRAGRTKDALIESVRQVGELAGKVATGGVVSATAPLGALDNIPQSNDLEPGREDEEITAEAGAESSSDNANSAGGDGNGNGNGRSAEERRGNPQPGAPGAGLPNLDEVRRARRHEPKAPDPVPSTKRGLRHERKRKKPNGEPQPTPTATPAPTPTATPVPTTTPTATAASTATPATTPSSNTLALTAPEAQSSSASSERTLLATYDDSASEFITMLLGDTNRTLLDSPFSIFSHSPSSMMMTMQNGQTPFPGVPFATDSIIQIEDFDNGGEGVAYHDADTGNNGGAYRQTGVDINNGPPVNIGWVQGGEWLEYTINVQHSGTYRIEVRGSTGGNFGTFHFEADGIDMTGAMQVPYTSNPNEWQTVTSPSPGIYLKAGQHIIRLEIDGSYGPGLDYFKLVTTQSPYNTARTPWSVPGMIQVEDFDNGGEGIAYHDNDASNNGGAYRQTGVDLNNGPPVNTGWVNGGEWLEYTINAQASGTYAIETRASTGNNFGAFHYEIDDADQTGQIVVPFSADPYQYQIVRSRGFYIEAGQHVVRLKIDGAAGPGFDYFRFVELAAPLVAHWKFDEASGATAADATGAGHTATIAGNVTRTVGRIGSGALNFSGASGTYLGVTSSPETTTIKDNFTVAFWAYPQSTHEIDSESTWIVSGNYGQKYAWEPPNPRNSEAGAGISVGTNGVSVYEHAPSYMPATLVHQATLTGWTHIAVVYENRRPKLYINGTLARTGLQSPRSAVRIHPAQIGGAGYGYYQGQLDDARLYTAALSPAKISALASAYTGTPAALPGTIQVEDFDHGGEGVAYHDNDASNNGGAYRQTGVDLNNGPPINTGWVNGGEWLKYTVEAGSSGTYRIETRASTGGNYGAFHYEIDGADVTGQISVPYSQNIYEYQIVHSRNFYVAAGQHTVRLFIDGASGPGFDYFRFVRVGATTETVWVEDSVPAGAIICTAGVDSSNARCEPNQWANTTPAPYSGVAAQQSDITTGIHQYFFSGASRRLPVGVGDHLFAYVYLDPLNPPKEIMLQWNAGLTPNAWEHRAYWINASEKALYPNLIPFGADGTQSRRYMGELPATGGWVRLDVPASLVGLEGQLVQGMAFTLHGGRATWDRAGKTSAQAASGTGLMGSYFATGGNTVAAFEDVRLVRVDPTVSFDWGSGAPAPQLGADNFAVRWTGQIEPRYSETYTLRTLSDDGVRLWVNGQLIIDNWTNHAVTSNTGPIALQAGQRYDIRMEYYDSSNGAVARLLWSSASQAEQIVPQSHLYPVMAPPQPASEAEISTTRLDEGNRTGGSDLFSGNYSWSLPLVSLPGRAGLDLGLSLAYNSLVWTKTGGAVAYDADNGYPSPGFRLGFPIVQSRFLNLETGKFTFMMITPSGARVEVRQVGATNVYESADSSYLQLVDYGGSLLLRTTDGTQLTFALYGDEYLCVQVKDANGNFITAAYNAEGDLLTVTDTLGRTLNFVYDSFQNLQSITQLRGTVSHVWATFGFGDQLTVTSGFTSLPTVGIQSGVSIPVLKQVGLPDGSYYRFEYNAHGQVDLIRYHGALNNTLNQVFYILQSDGTDCPKVSSRRVSAASWLNLGESAITTYADEGGGVKTATLPDGTIHKEIYATTGWMRGLVTGTETWGADTPGGSVVKQKWTSAVWEHDGASNAQYNTNPRVQRSAINDKDNNGRVTTVGYTAYGLPQDVRERDKNDVVLRRTHTDYNLAAAYTSQRIIGLPQAVSVYEGESTLVSKSEYLYDEGGEYLVGQGAVVGHDSTYDVGFVQGRGLVTSVKRRDVTDLSDAKASVVRTGYNTQGSPIFTRNPRGHQSSITYGADAFSDNVTRNFLAYPTQVTDPGGFSSKIKYNFHTGQVTRTEDPKTAYRTTEYDNADRVERVTSNPNGTYVRYSYAADARFVEQFTVVDTGQPEVSSTTLLDGMGRAYASATQHPGSTGGYRGQFTKFDRMGRVVETSNPVEMDVNWNAAGDDVAGWLYTKQTYDWKGRPRVITNTDLTTKQAVYGGCGCAGGESVELTDEVGRKQKVTSDVLGRTVNVKEYESNGTDVYRTTTNTYNARDQITQIFVQAGIGGAGQTTTVEYDGHGRTLSSKTPIQTATTIYAYNPDDSVQQVTDARGASMLYTYNNRGLVTDIVYQTPNATNIPTVASVAFGYDGMGNRVSMSDGAGRTDYTYDVLSRLEQETRQFNGLSGSFPLVYAYNLAGGVKSVTDPTGTSVNYTHDKTGQLTGVTGTSFGGVMTYVADVQYRAWGGVKQMTYGNNLRTSVNFNNRLQARSLDVNKQNPSGGSSTMMLAEYEYYADGQLRFADDKLDNLFDRAFSYDHVGRSKEAFTGTEARNFAAGLTGGTADGAYRQTYTHDVWNNLTNRTGRFWSQPEVFNANYTNHRRAELTYDAAGRVTEDETLLYKQDAAGRNVEVRGKGLDIYLPKIITQSYDGDGRAVKRTEGHVGGNPPPATYYLYSSVVGGLVMEMNYQGQRATGYVYAGGEMVAKQYGTSSGGWVAWQHRNPLTGSGGESSKEGDYWRSAEADPTGVNVGIEDPFTLPEPGAGYTPEPEMPILFGGGGSQCSSANPTCVTCSLDGFNMSCSSVMFLSGIGAAVQAPVLTTVRLTYTSGRTETFTGYTNLPPGMNITFTGAAAQAASTGFNIGRALGDLTGQAQGGFQGGVDTAVVAGNAAANTVPGDGNRANGGMYMSFANFFVPPQTNVSSRVKFIGSSNTVTQRNQGTILNVLNSIVNNEACNEAFLLAGLETPFNYFQRAGLTIGPASLLASNVNNKALGINSNKVRVRIYDKIREGIFYVGGSAVTLTGGGISTPRILFTANAFEPEYYDFRTEFIHELIHVLGRRANPDATPHDLGDFNRFDDIQLACGGKPLNNLPR